MADKSELIRTLIGSGFTPSNADARTNYLAILATRTELLGVRIPYLIAFTARPLNAGEVESLAAEAEYRHASLVIVGEVESGVSSISVLSGHQFADRLGGPIFSLLPFAPEYGNRLEILGKNELPKDLAGTPSDLFEQYVHAGLQCLFRSRVERYGQKRSGEPVPDGIAFGLDKPLFLYDAKAAKNGYDTNLESIRQFADYVNEFHKAYGNMMGRLTAFLVISGSFDTDVDGLQDRAIDFQSRCQVPLSFLTAAVFSEIVALLVQEPLYRQAVDWRRVFSRPVVRTKDVAESLKLHKKDAVIQTPKA